MALSIKNDRAERLARQVAKHIDPVDRPHWTRIARTERFGLWHYDKR